MSISATRAPALRSRSSDSSNRARTSSSSRSQKYDRGTASRRLLTGIGARLSQRTHVVERSRQRNDAVDRDLTERRFEPDDAAGRGGNANRAPGVGANRRERHAGGDARGGSTAGTTWRAQPIVRVARRPVRRVLVCRSERELVQI